MDLDSANGTPPTGLEVFNSADIQTHSLHENRKRFWIMKDINVRLADVPVKTVEYYRKLNAIVTWKGADGSTDLQKNHCYLLALSNESTNTPTVMRNTRAKFIDN